MQFKFFSILLIYLFMMKTIFIGCKIKLDGIL